MITVTITVTITATVTDTTDICHLGLPGTS